MTDSQAPDAGPAWHALTVAEVAARLEAREDGLDDAEATRRLDRFGPNRLRPPARPSLFARLGRQFANVLIYVLLGAAGLSAALGHGLDAAVIIGVVVVNAVIGFVQEGRAEHALAAIRDLLAPRATVIRAGRRRDVAADRLVPGDVVALEPGDRVPADIRLVWARNLAIDEAALTGESVPASKTTEPAPAGTAIGDRASIAHAGTLVATGHGRGLVVATGEATEIGRVSALLATVEPMTTPLLRRLARFGRVLTMAILTLAAATFAFGVLVHGEQPVDMVLAAVGIAVAAIPEGLPAILTIALAIGVQRMARRNAIVRRLPAVEALGSVTVVCTDKTGTLTRNEMTVRAVVAGRRRFTVEGAGYRPEGAIIAEGDGAAPTLVDLARTGILCNDATVSEADGQWRAEGDPTESALVAFAGKAGLDRRAERSAWHRLDAIPFSSEARFMATLHAGPDDRRVIGVKGAPERVFAMCETEGTLGAAGALDRAWWLQSVHELAEAGNRVLALAGRPAGPGESALDDDRPPAGLTLLGLVGISDPPRAEVIAAIARCRRAGLRIKMITGDHPATARAIARELGLGQDQEAATGPELDGLDDAEFAARAMATDVFARSSPEQKLRLVRALQGAGELVAMTGDGVNDAPALKQADIGVAMGIKGTEAAKEAAQIVLADDNFASIAHAIEEGRTIYDNLRKSIIYILPTSFAEALTVIAAVALGVALPITPVQILWINLITEVTLSLALAFERPEDDVMARPPRAPGEPLISGFLVWRVVAVTILFLAGTFGLFVWQNARGPDLATARTVAVNAVVALEIFYLFNARFLLAPLWRRGALAGMRPALGAVALVALLQLGFTYLPAAQAVFGTAPIDGAAWALIGLVGLAALLLIELEKAVLRRLRARRGPPG